MTIRIAVLMTCHNRKATALETLRALLNQQHLAGISLDIYLVDDGSTDGTAELVCQHYHGIKILQGTGALFWNGGMRTAFTAAAQSDYDYHLWLNEDTHLYPSAVATLLETTRSLAAAGYAPVIVSGSTCDPLTQTLTSGGFRIKWPRMLMRFELVEPRAAFQQCDTVSGNCVLIPRSIYQRLGNLNPNFSHFLGDLDYGLRAQQQGFGVWITGGYVGTSPQHHGRGNEVYELASLSDVLQKLRHPKGLNWGNDLQQRFLPLKEWTLFLQDHAGFLWFIPWLLTYQKLVGLVIRRWLTRHFLRFRNPHSSPS